MDRSWTFEKQKKIIKQKCTSIGTSLKRLRRQAPSSNYISAYKLQGCNDWLYSNSKRSGASSRKSNVCKKPVVTKKPTAAAQVTKKTKFISTRASEMGRGRNSTVKLLDTDIGTLGIGTGQFRELTSSQKAQRSFMYGDVVTRRSRSRERETK